MNKIINDPDTITRDIMEGYLYLYGKDYEMVPGTFGGMVKKESAGESVCHRRGRWRK